jgi:hypothetical protein
MVILVDGVQAVTGLRGIRNKTAQFLHKCNLSYAGHFMNLHQTWRLITTLNSSCIPIGVLYPGYRESSVTAQNSRHDRFPPAAND